MKFEITPMKVCAVLIFGIVAFGLTLSSLDSAVTRYERRNNLASTYKFAAYSPEAGFASEIIEPNSEPLARLFQILFILFIISPPLIVVMLFLIWKELKARNKLK